MANAEPISAQQVELRTTKASDICFALIGSILGPLELWGAASWVWSSDFNHSARDVRGGAIFVWINNTFGPLPLSIGFGLFGFWLLCLGIGGVWRLVDRSPAISASAEGLRFHPSVCRRFMPWSEVRYVRDVEGRPAQIRIGLARRFWSSLAWMTGTSVRLNRVALGLSEREAREVVRELKALSHGQVVPRRQSKIGSAQSHRRSKSAGDDHKCRSRSLADQKQTLIGLAIMVMSVAMFFWWGIHFRLFGHRIVFDMPEFGSMAWLASGMFGVGYVAGGWRSGLMSAAGFLVLAAAALGIGVVLGNYR